MATTTGTLWSEKTIHSGAPVVKSTATYEYEKVGTQLRIKIDTDNHCISSGAYWDWRWAFSVSVNGQEIASNIQIKPRTYLNTIGTHHYTASTGWCQIDIGTASEVTISVSYFDTVANNNNKVRTSMGGGTITLTGIPTAPNVSISQNNKKSNSISVNYSTDTSYDYVKFYVNNNEIGDFSNSPVNITGLNANTNYKITAKAHGNGGFGKQSNTLNVTTYLTPSVVSGHNISNLEPFSCSANINSSNVSNTRKYAFALCNSNKQVIQGEFQTTNSYYNFTGLQEETQYYIRYRVQSNDSGSWSDYVYSPLFKTPADQVRAWAKNGGNWNKGKMYYKQNGQWVKAKKVYIKINGQWVLSINKYD